MPAPKLPTLGVAGVLLVLTAASSPSQRITVHVTAADQQARRYTYVPFTVPPGSTALTVEYDYPRDDGANAVDFGLFEPGSTALHSPAFRGWSGGARSRITIGRDDATPGYWPGALPPGEWHAILGLYKVADAGVDVSIVVSTEAAPRAPRLASARPDHTPATPHGGPGWYSGIVHAHTTESDGALSVPELQNAAAAARLDFIAITDHNVTTHQRYPIDPRVLTISGEEVTTPAGHFNVLGLAGERAYVDFRFMAGDPALATTMAAAHRTGGLVIVNHPAADCVGCSWTHSLPDSIDAIEIANGTPTARAQAMAMWDVLLRQGRRVTAVEGRDWHRGPEPLAGPVLKVKANTLSSYAILEGIRRGRAVVVADANTPVPDLIVTSGSAAAGIGDTLAIRRGAEVRVHVTMPARPAGSSLKWIWNGEVAGDMTAADGALVRAVPHSGYGRIHVVDATGQFLAITNPVFITVH